MCGITPAHAGKSFPSHSGIHRFRDHPRTRGEKANPTKATSWRGGSPPHTRGKVVSGDSAVLRDRITPAHAGKSNSGGTICVCWKDHPRTRGEKCSPISEFCRAKGSPPHTRGKVARTALINGAGRITPAHAGKSSVSWLGKPEPEDHPRTRGEKFVYFALPFPAGGSPPHTRGKVWMAVYIRLKWRITPAHAGKRNFIRGCISIERDHPRTRGEKICVNFPPSLLMGSPPHTRGKDPADAIPEDGAGITPAHAGKSFCSLVS